MRDADLAGRIRLVEDSTLELKSILRLVMWAAG